ncbi:LapA family protein [Mycobacterium helveticum]|jgi:protein-S-isoprenylcysteine O-methyltransferase Ste14|nr:LapA family protein [Mycobacterium helveticum]
MAHSARGLVDDDRATRRDMNPPMQEGQRTPGHVVVAVAALVLLVGIANFALGHARAGVYAASIGLLAFGAGLAWLAMDRRRIRQAERDWLVGGR